MIGRFRISNIIFNGMRDPKPTESNANCGNLFMDTDLYNTMVDNLLVLDHSFGLNGKKILSCLKPLMQWISLKEQEECLKMKLATRRMQFNLYVIFCTSLQQVMYLVYVALLISTRDFGSQLLSFVTQKEEKLIKNNWTSGRSY